MMAGSAKTNSVDPHRKRAKEHLVRHTGSERKPIGGLCNLPMC